MFRSPLFVSGELSTKLEVAATMSILLAGLLVAAASSSLTADADKLSTLVPAGVDLDAACFIVSTEVDLRYQQMTGDQKMKFADFHNRAEMAINFYLSAAIARRTPDEFSKAAHDAKNWEQALSADVKPTLMSACYNAIAPRIDAAKESFGKPK